MREKHRSTGRTHLKGENCNPKKKYFLIFEGSKTEDIYFEAVKNYLSDKIIEIVPLIRNESEKTISNPERIMEILLCRIKEQQEEKCSYSTLINWIVDYIKEEKIILRSSKVIKSELEKVCTDELKSELSDLIEKADFENKLEEILEYYIEKTENRKDKSKLCNIREDVERYIREHEITYISDIDEMALVADRDKESFTESQYDSVVLKCKENNIKFFVTNPCFEFWLLMHFDDVKQIDKDRMQENAIIHGKTTYSFSCLKEAFPDYRKNRFDADVLMNRLDKALENERSFCEDTEGLKYSIGSNVGLLIKELGYNSL